MYVLTWAIKSSWKTTIPSVWALLAVCAHSTGGPSGLFLHPFPGSFFQSTVANYHFLFPHVKIKHMAIQVYTLFIFGTYRRSFTGGPVIIFLYIIYIYYI